MAAKKERPVVIDFETFPIEERPHYPPKPVGVSIMLPSDKKPKYYAFGHPVCNNCTERDAQRALANAYADAHMSGAGILCHHSKFDLDVAETHWGLELPRWELIHDTVFLIFLENPYSQDLKLKPAAHRLLGMAPDEQDAILQWAIDNKLLARNAKNAGPLICKAPGDLVGKYADGDVIRTLKLYQLLHKRVTVEMDMAEAYDRERRLMPILLQNERDGLYADRKLLGQHDKIYTKAMSDAVAWVGKTLKTPDLNLDAPKDVLAALMKAGKVDEEKLLLTPGGDYSASKDSLLGAVTDKRVLQVLQYQSKLATALNTFIKPWHRQAEATKGTIHPSWNQVRLHGAGGDAGAKTGRLSASRFMNVPKEFEEEEGKFEHPRFKGIELPELPMVRHYLLPDPGQVWIKRDYSSQELRVLGHFEDGALLDHYIEDPELDVHQLAGDMLIEMGFFDGDRKKARKGCKTIGFGLLYGMGLGALAVRLDTDVKQAGIIKNAYLEIFPGLKDLQKELTARGKAGLSLRTWGGRVYFVEPPKFMEKRGRVVTFEYKLLNFLIQGSSADCTKEAVIRYHDVRKDGRFLVMVHDEVNISAPKSKYKQEAQVLREAMGSVEFDVPMLSDGKFGPNWGSLKPIGEKLWLPTRFQQAA